MQLASDGLHGLENFNIDTMVGSSPAMPKCVLADVHCRPGVKLIVESVQNKDDLLPENDSDIGLGSLCYTQMSDP